jgi:pimeloyl-ACP methyl ester carboxylesterase
MAASARSRAQPARPLLLALEAPRAALEAQALVPALPLLRAAPRGDGHPVLVLPGFTASDLSTRVLRAYLRRRDYAAHGWQLGRNVGLEGEIGGRMRDRLLALHAEHGRRVSLVGWSLGGIYARELAKLAPGCVRQVITLGSPFALLPPPPVPATAIYSRSDGVVAWQDCRELESARTDNVEIVGSHCGLGVNPLVLFAVADRLAQPESGWKPFDRSGWRGAFFR